MHHEEIPGVQIIFNDTNKEKSIRTMKTNKMTVLSASLKTNRRLTGESEKSGNIVFTYLCAAICSQYSFIMLYV